MGNRWDTEMGGNQRRFCTTCWTVIVNSQSTDEECKKAILDDLFHKYWKPVYWYIRRKGYPNEKAKDLTQGFFGEIVWGRDLIQSANPQKGRFRNFLLTALERYLTDTYRFEHSQKRMPANGMFSYEATDGFELADSEEQMNAEEAFNCVWLMELLRQSFEDVKSDMEDAGMGDYWTLFEKRCLNPITDGDKPPSLQELCKTLKIQDLTKASNMIVTTKRRLKKKITQNLLNVSGCDSTIEDEISELLGKLSI